MTNVQWVRKLNEYMSFYLYRKKECNYTVDLLSAL